jgi:hypothetical protein
MTRCLMCLGLLTGSPTDAMLSPRWFFSFSDVIAPSRVSRLGAFRFLNPFGFS